MALSKVQLTTVEPLAMVIVTNILLGGVGLKNHIKGGIDLAGSMPFFFFVRRFIAVDASYEEQRFHSNCVSQHSTNAMRATHSTTRQLGADISGSNRGFGPLVSYFLAQNQRVFGIP